MVSLHVLPHNLCTHLSVGKLRQLTFSPRLLTSDLCIPAAPSAPSFIHFSELTTTSVNVSWGEPTFPNGIIEGFRLVYEPCTPVDGKALILTCSIFSSLLK